MRINGDSPPFFIHSSNPKYVTYLRNEKVFDTGIY